MTQRWSLAGLVLAGAVWTGIAWVAAACAGEPPVYRQSVRPHWLTGSRTKFWYRVDLADGARQFVLVNAERGTREAAFDHARVAAALGKLLDREIPADKLPVERLAFEADGRGVILHGRQQAWRMDLADCQPQPWTVDEASLRWRAVDRSERPTRDGGPETRVTFDNRGPDSITVYWVDPSGQRRPYATIKPGAAHDQHTFAGHVWLVTGKGGAALGVFQATEEPARVRVNGTDVEIAAEEESSPAAPTASSPVAGRRSPESPDGKWRAFIQGENLYLRAKDTDEAFALTDNGSVDDRYDVNKLWWSPDSSKLVAIQTQPAQDHTIYLVESSPRDQIQPKLHARDYLKPGDRIERPRPRLLDVAARRAIPVDDGLFSNPWSIQDVRWTADGSRFTFVYNQRGHQVLRVVAVDAATGQTRALVDEHSDTFICYSSKSFCHWIGDEELIWMSERDGWNHLWLYDARSGQVKNQITRGPWVVREVVHVDDQRRQIWFHAGGVHPGQDPYYQHFCRVDFTGEAFVTLTEGDGDHRVQWSPDEPYFLDTWSRVDLPPVTELRASDDGRRICLLEEADATAALAARGGCWPERFVAKGRDGTTDIHGIILRPRDFDPANKYPVVEQIYAGPQGFYTPKSFRVDYGQMQRIADLGLIVVQCDGMGTSGRSKAFHDVCWRNLRDAGFPDRIAWIQAAAREHPELDLTRVGIYGGSAGGQNALAALLWHGDFYHVAVADCGCHDNRMDKIWWNEQWMGWPVDEHYAESSNVIHAHLLRGKLMLVVGELDENVDPASTLQVAAALQRADKDFDLIFMAGTGHAAAEAPYAARRRAEFLKQHLLGR